MKFVLSIISLIIMISTFIVPPILFKKQNISLSLKKILLGGILYIMFCYIGGNGIYGAIVELVGLGSSIVISSIVSGIVFSLLTIASYLFLFKMFYKDEINLNTICSIALGFALAQILLNVFSPLLTYVVVCYHMFNNSLLEWLTVTMPDLTSESITYVVSHYESYKISYALFLGISGYIMLTIQMIASLSIGQMLKEKNKKIIITSLLATFLFGTLYQLIPSINLDLALVIGLVFLALDFVFLINKKFRIWRINK